MYPIMFFLAMLYVRCLIWRLECAYILVWLPKGVKSCACGTSLLIYAILPDIDCRIIGNLLSRLGELEQHPNIPLTIVSLLKTLIAPLLWSNEQAINLFRRVRRLTQPAHRHDTSPVLPC